MVLLVLFISSSKCWLAIITREQRMQTGKASEKSDPLFPAPLSKPLRVLPAFVHNKMLITALNRMFDEEILAGELDFLQDKVVNISIQDADIRFSFSFARNRIISTDRSHSPDLELQGTVYSYLLLASRQEDTDTLFFSRRLSMQGDTELGLYVKNFLDGMDMDSHKIPAYLSALLHKSLPVYKRLFG